ncbi:xanthine dehydrogenase family protein molybdopterin-binding subunit [Notoacmeibacter sp. MSK16QG-6]|uniref:xanthine dehydrogenase family protein molybdopterin-binding subunit n=1 Tax=Notoacmeibacter sp. MSK16QG-6 TaxID=2957982 RepID=UPI0020A12F79|nr:xanthine dehydrogenase family protein molybdopterin-binding subunit [Notoacmeibacter sp. MSK16QG-6]MCP1198107.1 xanthine dehydrogenase family protein molybdopterin-binding subunit [Notoacmeibacter sp. MSK16QG-6]
MSVAPPKFGLGQSVKRVEDDLLLTGQGRYTDDEKRPGLLHAVMLRSPVACGSFSLGDLSEARAAPGVKLILTADDIGHLKPLKTGFRPRQPDGSKPEGRSIPILARDETGYMGDALAFIVAETRDQAADALELIPLTFEGGEAVVDIETVADGNGPLVGRDLSSNIAYRQEIGDEDATAKAFDGAHHVTTVSFWNNRLVANYMEARSALGEYVDGRYHLTAGTQGVHNSRSQVSTSLGVDESEVQVRTYDVGGGFGPKAFAYREDVLVCEAARRLGAPVKWTADRTDHFLTDAQGRDNFVTASMAMDENGRFIGLKIDLIANMGAYTSRNAMLVPYLGASMATGLYDIGALHMAITGVYTHTAPVDAYRGAGRPEAALLIEKLVDVCARELGLTQDDIRRRNFIQEFPYTTLTGRNYDVGEPEGHMDAAMTAADWRGFDDRLKESGNAGRLRGIGMATYIEACAFAGSEPADLRLKPNGRLLLKIGTQSNGQGHKTAYAQFIADLFSLPVDRIDVEQGDSDALPSGGGTGGSRSIPIGGVSVRRAGEVLEKNLRQIASDELEADAADLEFFDGGIRVAGTDRMLSLAHLAAKATDDKQLAVIEEVKQDEATYPNGTHICEVEIDPETGKTVIMNYVVTDDFGVAVNPLLLEGQVMGGIAQGIGQALLEASVYSPEGQLISASFMDYAMPRADNIPGIDFNLRNVPSTTNALGIKGAGEAGSIGATPAVLNAVVDALHRAYGITHIEMPTTPLRVWETIRAASH